MASYEIYCDESRQELFYDKDKTSFGYVLIGGIWLDAAQRARVKSDIKGIRAQNGLHTEFKWTKVGESGYSFYSDIIRYFFNEDALKFRTIVLKNNELDAITFHNGDNELMFYKFYYQLIKHWIEDGNTYRIIVDLKTNRKKDRLKTLQRYLQSSNLAANIEFVQALPSNEVDLIQLADLLLGAVGASFTGHIESGNKLKLLALAEELRGHPLHYSTNRYFQKFNVFRCHPGMRW